MASSAKVEADAIMVDWALHAHVICTVAARVDGADMLRKSQLATMLLVPRILDSAETRVRLASLRANVPAEVLVSMANSLLRSSKSLRGIRHGQPGRV